MAVLTPRLAPLDEKVLAALSDTGMRAERVAQLTHGRPTWLCDACGRGAPMDGRHRRLWAKGEAIICLGCYGRALDGMPGLWFPMSDAPRTMRPFLATTPGQRAEVREVLRGLERIGAARQAGGWWRRA